MAKVKEFMEESSYKEKDDDENFSLDCVDLDIEFAQKKG